MMLAVAVPVAALASSSAAKEGDASVRMVLPVADPLVGVLLSAVLVLTNLLVCKARKTCKKKRKKYILTQQNRGMVQSHCKKFTWGTVFIISVNSNLLFCNTL